ncbi:MAG: 3-deoxy-D-manno-octulosonic acid transferase [Saprospiraceae bacterium]|nr:3-deoxy-D-manno-octulosonic acid transferase [Saprospiraceae bacterium]
MSNGQNCFQLWLYNCVTQVYFLGIRIASAWNEKARKWVKGRVAVWDDLSALQLSQRPDNQRLLWMHCASLGEFEQGRPFLEAIRNKYPNIQILLTFFSPSGYEIRKDYPVANWVAYLPADSASNANKFLKMVRPDLVLFVKYEFWYHYLTQLKENGIPCLLISAIFRPSQAFFKWYGGLHRSMLGAFSNILVQDEASKDLLSQNGLYKVGVVGDTRVDRVAEIAANPIDLPLVKDFCGDHKILVCGSTWPLDEKILSPIFSSPFFEDWKFILAPHDIQSAHLKEIASKLLVPFTWFSKLGAGHEPSRLLVVDTIGLLSSIYQFGHVAYIGGGFEQGVHNTLEPAAFGLPIVFGPKFQKFGEARWMVANGAAFEVRDGKSLFEVLITLENPEFRMSAAQTSRDFIHRNKGGTKKVLAMAEVILFRQLNQ